MVQPHTGGGGGAVVGAGAGAGALFTSPASLFVTFGDCLTNLPDKTPLIRA